MTNLLSPRAEIYGILIYSVLVIYMSLQWLSSIIVADNLLEILSKDHADARFSM